MNERIKELVVLCSHTETTYVNGIDESTEVFDKEKFAELIVKECEKVAKGGSWYYDAPSCGWRNPINHVCNVMKEHFGVE